MKHKLIFFTFIMISIFSTCKSQQDEKYMYLAGWEVKFNGDDQCNKFIQTQAIDINTANTLYSSVELIFKNEKLVSAFDIEEGRKTERKLIEIEKNFKYVEVEPKQIFQLNNTSSSESYLGGEPPSDFKMPKFDFNAPFQYLGKFSKKDEAFSWLPFDLHLVAPIYLNIDKLFIDYSEPNNPKVINLEDLKRTDNSYDDLKPNSEIIFKKVYIKTQKANDYGSNLGHTGVPSWIQYPDIPLCPKNNKIMRFLCQLRSDAGVMTEKTNVNPKDDWYKQYFNQMNFWGDGDLFVFFDPESKIACFFIQNT